MIYITGDTHGEWINRLNENAFPEQLSMTKKDYVIVLGDFGAFPQLDKELDWLEKRNFTTLFISGNHENYDYLDSLSETIWNGGKVNKLRPSIIHLKRGQVFEIENKKFFTFGGASSHDIEGGILDPNDPLLEQKKKMLKEQEKCYRINHVSWWERELPSKEEMIEGNDSLVAVNFDVDFILTHSPYSSILNKLDGGFGLYKTDYLTDYLEDINNKAKFTYWFFGHMHIDEQFKEEKAIGLFEQIIRIS